jgi:hypothetical protein
VSATKWYGRRSYDCSGLIVWCLKQLGLIPSKQDYSAYTLYHQLCTPVLEHQLQPGDLVFKQKGKSITHVGLYSGNGKTVEAMGTRYGVTQGKLSNFNLYGRLKFKIDVVENEKFDIPVGIGVVTASMLNVREGAGTQFEDVGDLSNGQVVPIFEIKEGWCKIAQNKWVSIKYVKTTMLSNSTADFIVENLINAKLITSKEYWLDVLSGKKKVNPEYLKIVYKRSEKIVR